MGPVRLAIWPAIVGQALLSEKPVEAPFKCATDENRQAWEMFAREFFAGIDLVGSCPFE